MSDAQTGKVFTAWPQIASVTYAPRTDLEYLQLIKLQDCLVDKIGEQENQPLASLMNVLGVLIEKYEDENVAELKA